MKVRVPQLLFSAIFAAAFFCLCADISCAQFARGPKVIVEEKADGESEADGLSAGEATSDDEAEEQADASDDEFLPEKKSLKKDGEGAAGDSAIDALMEKNHCPARQTKQKRKSRKRRRKRL